MYFRWDQIPDFFGRTFFRLKQQINHFFLSFFRPVRGGSRASHQRRLVTSIDVQRAFRPICRGSRASRKRRYYRDPAAVAKSEQTLSIVLLWWCKMTNYLFLLKNFIVCIIISLQEQNTHTIQNIHLHCLWPNNVHVHTL
jgi:hypothetical protein